MTLFPDGIIANTEDFYGLTVKTSLVTADRWLSMQPFQSQIYYCPKGSGKTTLIRYFLSEEKRSQLATENKLLIKDCPLSTSFLHSDAGVFCCLIDAIFDSISILNEKDQEWFNGTFRSEMEKDSFFGFRKDKDKAFELIKCLTAILKSKGFFTVLVMDDFHLLTCSSSCDTNTFNNMAHLDQLGLLGYIVLSDYHVSVGSQAYRMSEFERIFGDHIHSIPKIKKSKQKMFLFSKIHAAIRIQQEMDETEPEEAFDISDEELTLLMNLTDGIPGMIQNAINSYYLARQQKNGNPLTSDEFLNVVFEGCKPLMREWVHYLKDTAHWDTLRIIYDNPETNTTTALERDKDTSSVLTDTGLLTIDSLNRKYIFTCPLFERFIAEELQRPFQMPSETDKLLKAIEQQSGNTINITIDNSTENTTNNTLRVENTIIAPGLTASGILQLLNTDRSTELIGDTRASYASALAKQFGSIQRQSLPQFSNSIIEETIESQMEQDTAFDEFGSQIVQNVNIDDNQDLLDVSPEELETLDKRFSEARNRNVRSGLTDSFLSALSERCQFYLKLSVVVEDALSFIKMDDYSPQLVLYGKALEQSLRDNFFDLFHSDSTLSSYPVDSEKTFLDVLREKSYISAYQFIIRDNTFYLSQLAKDNNVQFQNENMTVQWWKALNTSIHHARLIRNMADHAGNESPTQKNVDEIYTYLLGKDDDKGILLKANAGRYLWNMISTGDFSVGDLLSRDSCVVTITEIKPDGRMNAIIDNCSISVKISRKKVQRFIMNNPDVHFVPEMKISAKLLEYSNNGIEDFFVGKIISV